MIAGNSHVCTWSADDKRAIALTALVEAHRYAVDLQRPIWDFAVAWTNLEAAGLNSNDLRWLLAKGYVELADEIGKPSLGLPRRFRNSPTAAISRRTCVAMTAAGIAFADGMFATPPEHRRQRNGAAGIKKRPPAIPHWDAAARKLWFGNHLIKQFKVPAKNQELVLAAFDEEGWPPCIDDPLPPQDGIDAKTRLHDTIIRLNRSHKTKRIRFHGNGNGLAVHYLIVSPTQNVATKSTPKRR